MNFYIYYFFKNILFFQIIKSLIWKKKKKSKNSNLSNLVSKNIKKNCENNF